MKRMGFSIVIIVLSLIGSVWAGDSPLKKCSMQPLPTPERHASTEPECGIELTCTDKPVLLGNAQGVCFRATCPGIWALIHTRVDQESFRRRLFTYRHYSFKGYWDLKDQGVIEAGPAPVRELFLVLPDDLIEFKLTNADCYARIELRKLGYIKTGTVKELQEWAAYNSYLEKAAPLGSPEASAAAAAFDGAPGSNGLERAVVSAMGGLFSAGRTLGFRCFGR